MGRKRQGICEMCGREVIDLTEHHLIPRTRHSNRRNKRDFTREEVRERLMLVCPPCHKTIHAVLTNKQLEREFNTRESILEREEIRKFVRWVRKQPPYAKVRVKMPADGGPGTNDDLRRGRKNRRGR
ncbi:MAG: HNH endonuclease [Phycisphaerae bacterium]